MSYQCFEEDSESAATATKVSRVNSNIFCRTKYFDNVCDDVITGRPKTTEEGRSDSKHLFSWTIWKRKFRRRRCRTKSLLNLSILLIGKSAFKNFYSYNSNI